MMMGFAWWFIVLAAVAALFVAWPLVVSRRNARQAQIDDEIAGRIAFNDALFAERLQELDDQLQLGEISQARYDKLKSELEEQNRHDTDIEDAGERILRSGGRPFLLAAAVVLPLLGWFMYTQLGAADDVHIQRLNDQLVQLQQSGETANIRELNQELAGLLKQRLQLRPDNLNNRFLLARTAVELRDFPLALESYRYILERQPNSPAILAEIAQVAFIASGNRFTAEVQQLFDQALALDPDNGELLGFAGLAAYQSGQFKAAIGYWERGSALLPAADPRKQSWQDVINQARNLAGEPVPEAADHEAGAGVSLKLAVSLADGVDAPPGARVFVYARAWEGPKAPLAMQQLQVSQLPATVELDESMSMVPNLTMSRFPELELVARVSVSGSAEPQPGDWEASLGPVESASSTEVLQLVIESQLP